LQDVDLDVASGEFVCLVGQSGCGKSTLLEIVARQELWPALALFWGCTVTASWASEVLYGPPQLQTIEVL
jgi:ABC-type iron transport system FetAB ATPase subunit